MTLIDRLGIKRVIVIGVLAGFSTVLLLANLYVISPNKISSKQQLVVVRGETSKLQGEVDKMKADYDVFMKQKQFFENVSNMGFFNNQDRVLARERFDTIQRLSKVISARYEIKPAAIIDEADPNQSPDIPVSDYFVMESPITLTLSAIDDLDIYSFIYYLNYGFDGYITIKDLTVERKMPVDVASLKLIGRGNTPEMVSAKLELSWTTMAKKSEADPSAAPASGENGQPEAVQ